MTTALRVEDAATGQLIMLAPLHAYRTPEVALQCAAIQARRHAAGGRAVVLRGWVKPRLYQEGRCFVPCDRCSAWMPQRRRSRGPHCRVCRRTAADAAAPGEEGPK